MRALNTAIAEFPRESNGIWLQGILQERGILSNIHVVGFDEFDADDNAGPGTTYVEVTAQIAQLWQAFEATPDRPRGQEAWAWIADQVSAASRGL